MLLYMFYIFQFSLFLAYVGVVDEAATIGPDTNEELSAQQPSAGAVVDVASPEGTHSDDDPEMAEASPSAPNLHPFSGIPSP